MLRFQLYYCPHHTYNANMPVNCLYASIRAWYQEFGMDEFLDCEHDAVLDTQTNSSPNGILR